MEGRYQIIHGARRFRASVMAGLLSIPAIVQVDEVAFDDYSQVLENTQRDNLALWILRVSSVSAKQLASPTAR